MDLFKSREFNLFLPFVRAQYNIKGAHEVKGTPHLAIRHSRRGAFSTGHCSEL